MAERGATMVRLSGVLLLLVCLGTMVTILLTGAMIFGLDHDLPVLNDYLAPSDERVRLALSLVAALFAAQVVFLILWMVCAAANARRLRPEKRRMGPFAVALWWIVPPFNLWQPYRAMNQIWNSSVEPEMGLNDPPAPSVTSWWIFQVLAIVTGALLAAALPTATDMTAIFGSYLTFAVIYLTSLGALVHAMRLITATQLETLTAGRLPTAEAI
ncbi:MAG: DUF4328 domain-containing protein [Tabrizicola sp.]|nr:DUF4328 domain-containing protein [Tabrizicola sp.]